MGPCLCTSVRHKCLSVDVCLYPFSQVVMETILVDSEEKKKFHLKLAKFFLDHCKDEDRVIFMAPEQLKLAGEKKRLLEFLRKDQRSVNKSGFWKLGYYKVILTINTGSKFHYYFMIAFLLGLPPFFYCFWETLRAPLRNFLSFWLRATRLRKSFTITIRLSLTLNFLFLFSGSTL